MKDQLGVDLKVGQHVVWSTSGYFGGLRFGLITAIDEKQSIPGNMPGGVMVSSVLPYKPGGWKSPTEVAVFTVTNIPADWKPARTPRTKD
jgi:hypothetical protein